MAEYNPNDADKRKRLLDAMQWSYKEMRTFREFHRRQVKHFTGQNYGQVDIPEQPVNMFRMAIDLYQRHLAGGEPRVLARTKNTELRTEAYELKLATDFTLKEMNFRRTLREVVKNALFTLGVARVGLTESELNEASGILHDAGQPYCDSVQFEDFVFDASKERYEQCDFAANYYQLDYDTVMEADIYDVKAKNKIHAAEGQIDEMGLMDDAEGVKGLGRQSNWAHATYRKMVNLVDVWLPYDRVLLTMHKDADTTTPPLRVMEWEGPERGPYHLLSFSDVPGNIMPVSPGSHLIELNRYLNNAVVKLSDQAERQKTFTVLGNDSASSGDGDRVRDVGDGEIMRSETPDQIREVRFGGPDQALMGFAVQLRNWMSYAGGNLDTLGGLAQQAETATQERMLQSNSGDMITSMEDSVTEFVSAVSTDIAYLQYTNPILTLNLTKKIEGTKPPIEIPFKWTPERRQQDFWSFEMQIDPYSLRPRTPEQRLRQLMQYIQQILLPASPLMAQQGQQIDWNEVISLLARYSHLEELQFIIKTAGEPTQANPYTSGDPTSPTVSHRENVRINQPGGGTQGARDNLLVQSLMGGEPQINQDQQAALNRQ